MVRAINSPGGQGLNRPALGALSASLSSLSSSAVDEGETVGTVIGGLSVTGSTDAYTFLLTNAGAGNYIGLLETGDRTANLRVAISPVYADNQSVTVVVQATNDVTAEIVTRSYVIAINQVVIAPADITPPVLSLDVPADTYPPELKAVIDDTLSIGDSVRLQSSANENFSPVILDVSNEIDAGEAGAGEAAFAGLSGIVSPTETFFRAFGVNGSGQSDPSNTVKHGDVTAPTITSSLTPSGSELVPMQYELTASETVTWQIIGGLDIALVELSGSTVQLVGNADLNFEDKETYAFNVRATDLGGNVSEASILFTVVDIDEVADQFTFTDVSAVTASTQQTSNTITIAGLAEGVSVPVSITGGTYSKNGGGYGSAATTAVNGDTFAVRHNSAAGELVAVDTVLSVGVTSDAFTSTTESLSVQPFVASATQPALVSASGPTNTWDDIDFEVGTGVLFCRHIGSGRSITGITVDGVAATEQVEMSTGDYVGIWTIPITTAGLKQVVVTYSNSNSFNKSFITGTLVGAASAVPYFVSEKVNAYTNTPTTFPNSLVRNDPSVTLMFISSGRTVTARNLDAQLLATNDILEVSELRADGVPGFSFSSNGFVSGFVTSWNLT